MTTTPDNKDKGLFNFESREIAFKWGLVFLQDAMARYGIYISAISAFILDDNGQYKPVFAITKWDDATKPPTVQ